MTDWELLRKYRDQVSQQAFTCLVDRHMKLVYWTCKRELKSDQLAEDATQAVFLLLARKGKTLRFGISLPGWLFQAARLVCKDVRKSENRRMKREADAAQTRISETSDNHQWNEVEPWLNDSLSKLSASDRQEILLRFFDDLSLKEVAIEIGTSEDTARKRISRAIDKLRISLQRREVTISSSNLSTVLITNSAKQVPESVTISAHSALNHQVLDGVANNLQPTLWIQGVNLIMQGTIYKSAICVAGVILFAVIGFGGYQHWANLHRLSPREIAVPGSYTDLVTTSPRATSDPSEADKKAISIQLLQFVNAGNTHNVDTLRPLIGPDATFPQQNGTVWSASQEIAGAAQDFKNNPNQLIFVTLDSITVQGDHATIHATTENQRTPSGHPQQGVIRWVKQGGEWLIEGY